MSDIDSVLQRVERVEADVAELKRQFAQLRQPDSELPVTVAGISSLTREAVAAFKKEGEAVKQRLRALETHS